MVFLVNTKCEMQGNLVCLLENFISCSTNVFFLITVNKLKTHLKHSFYTYVDLYNHLSSD
jgi:hypothetical protein